MTAPLQPPAGRYGPERGPASPRRRVVALSALGAVALAGGLWLGIGAARTPVTWSDVGFTLGDGEVEVVYEVVRLEPQTVVHCTIEALNGSYAQVGVLDVRVPPAEERSVRLASTVQTSEPAVTGVVSECWIP
ncbi:DUF4307 domain-containing protein [Actinotalea sp. C106]|uniref:DUF4307 domain-containing protein n=1 Tax=Actinotalea sp. C106 TaxID=2908644 RepID=UPI002028B2DE|nr:DUF4307 domain-containing protein [Actinotalea sp. C106]